MPAVALGVDADLEFLLTVPSGEAGDGSGTAGHTEVSGRLTGSGAALQLSVSDPVVFAGRSDARAVRGIAEVLAANGLTVTVVAPSGPVVTLGAPRTPWWQRRVTGSRHIRIERGARLWSLARGRARATAGALPHSDLVPPATVWPLLPTFLRRPRTVATTHDPDRGGNPRLVLAPRAKPGPDDAPQAFPLSRAVTTIGSAVGCDVRLPGLEPVHAEVRHDDLDEFVLVAVGDARTLVNGAPVRTALLRTASRVQVGGWTLSFYREEYADHGRPYGGRIGGELGRQRPQPRRTQASSVSDWDGTAPQHRSPGSR